MGNAALTHPIGGGSRETFAGYVLRTLRDRLGGEPFAGDERQVLTARSVLGAAIADGVRAIGRKDAIRARLYREQLRELIDPALTKKRRAELVKEIKADLDPVGSGRSVRES